MKRSTSSFAEYDPGRWKDQSPLQAMIYRAKAGHRTTESQNHRITESQNHKITEW